MYIWAFHFRSVKIATRGPNGRPNGRPLHYSKTLLRKSSQYVLNNKHFRNQGLVEAPRPNAGRSEKTRENPFFLDITSSYAKILGETNFPIREFPRSGSKAEGVEKKKKKKVGENNGQLRFFRHHGWRTQARLDQNSRPQRKSIPKILLTFFLVLFQVYSPGQIIEVKWLL